MQQSGLSVGQLEALKEELRTKGADSASSSLSSASIVELVKPSISTSTSTSISKTPRFDPDTLSFSSDTSVPPFDNSSEGSAAQSVGSASYLNNPAPAEARWLHNQQLPSVLIKHEKVEHRIMLFLKAQGKSNREVAEFLGYSDAQVSQVVRQAWFLEGLRELLDTIGGDLVQAMLKGAATDSVITLIDLRDDPKVPAAVRKNCASDLLDRYLGKPKQSVEVNQKTDPLKRGAEIDANLEDLEAREAEVRRQLGALVE